MLYAVAPWISDSFPIIRVVLVLLIVLISLALIFIVLFQPGVDRNNLGAISGTAQSDTYYSKNKAQTFESALKRLTVVLGIMLLILSVAFFITVAIYSGL